MIAWLRESPVLARAGVLSLGIAVIAKVALASGKSVHWETALIYGVTLGVAMRWPIIMSGTGTRVVLITGLLLDALWRHGLWTALVLVLVEFGARMLTLHKGRHTWEWYRPLIVLTTMVAAYRLALAVSGEAAWGVPSNLPRIETASLTFAYGFWLLLNAAWSVLKAPVRGRSRVEEYNRCMAQTWWAPLVYLLVAWSMQLVRSYGYPLEAAVCLLLLWVQYQVGPVFTTLHQDRAVADMVRLSPVQSHAHRLNAQRVLRVAHTIARAVPLSDHEIRQLGYAALLQDYHPETDPAVPLWLTHKPVGAQRDAIHRHVEETVLRIERDGSLQEVSLLVRFRYASYDGEGYPEVCGDVIPVSAQVLAAANAIVHLTTVEGGQLASTPTHAAEWLRDHAAARFSPRVINALLNAFVAQGSTSADVKAGLPETVRQLQGLLAGPESPPGALVGLRRLWMQLRGKVGLVPELPQEVQAVARLATFFASSTNAERTAQITVEAVGQLIGGKVALALGEADDLALSMRFRATHGFLHLNLMDRPLPVQGGQMSRALLEQAPVQVADLREMSNTLSEEIAAVEHIRSVLFVPLSGRGKAIGMLIVGMQNYHWFTPQEVGLIHLMAGQAAMALENARLIAEVADRLDHISRLKAFTDTLLDNLSSNILVVDTEGRLVMMNATARARHGHEFELGQPLPEFYSQACRIQQTLSGEISPEEDVLYDGGIMEVASIPLKDDNGVLQGAICIARDVTKVRMMEQQVRRVEKLAAIGELAAGAAHEIRNPLTSIRGFMQLLQARATSADGGDYFQIILSEIDRIDGIIRDLLLLARPSELQRVETSIPALLDEVLLFSHTEFDRQGITIVREFDPDVGPVLVDPKMFKQLLLNLVINAFQAMPYGGTLRLSLGQVDTSHVALAVADTGVGMSPENLKRLFVPFFTTKEEGTGLGLALCHSIVQAHHGRIDVGSRVGLGTTFTITLPVK